jgi:hypothetical protein
MGSPLGPAEPDRGTGVRGALRLNTEQLFHDNTLALYGSVISFFKP